MTSDVLPLSPEAPSPEERDLPISPEAAEHEAVEDRSTQSLTLDQAVELAEQNSRLLQIARLQVEVLKTIQQEAESTLLPRVVLGANLTYERQAVGEFLERQLGNALGDLRNTIDQRVEDLVPPQFRPLAEREINLLNSFADRALADIINRAGLSSIGRSANLPFSATAAVVYDPDIWGARAAVVQAAELEVQTGKLELERQREDLRLLIATEYYNLQEADALVRITEAALDNALSVLADAQALQSAGVGTQLDVRRTQVLVANIRQGLEVALTLQTNSRRRLVQRLGLPITADVTAADPVAVAGTWDLSLDESIEAALQNRRELDELQLQQAVNRRQEHLARAGNRPQLSLFASYSVLNVLNAPFNPGFADGYAVGGTLLWELYDGGATRSRVARTQLNQEILANRLADVESEIWLQVEEIYNDLQATATNIETAAVTVSEAEEVLRQSRLGFNAGVVTQLEVTTAQTNLTDAETRLVRSILDYNRALAALQRSVNLPGEQVGRAVR
ncbi:TolC family protein [Nodosilinea sp. P-1105]|uniref:TolC family protein n=1 Tax=Nodosilinea sp. P-1105 TaxID=2546229 RepID=UPI00146DC98B|nr:TolC family protein [Nodosilinea sp. P-1105]